MGMAALTIEHIFMFVKLITAILNELNQTTASRHGNRLPFGTRVPRTMLSKCAAVWKWPSWVVGQWLNWLHPLVPHPNSIICCLTGWNPTMLLFIGRAMQLESNLESNEIQQNPTIVFCMDRASQICSQTKSNEIQPSNF